MILSEGKVRGAAGLLLGVRGVRGGAAGRGHHAHGRLAVAARPQRPAVPGLQHRRGVLAAGERQVQRRQGAGRQFNSIKKPPKQFPTKGPKRCLVEDISLNYLNT